ncbi:hypothetical protein GCK72_023511 [Caenorhabditis remanei]|uniref:Uncharacterized protein n=2 Tax=Caenorhabditis remanei TaxID=31234 RepID=E3MMP7_CAERE|nr:hypothetical protein GCK72_023511 [Caenorhabditis remanei]EFP05048.1 hypothetical protein CRE_03205 [Caenorhabditis remanei]KAF1747053.1 hypothetical protein GCK72_023511 [Caenorhabditis remanei]
MNISNSTDFEPVSELQSYGTLSAASFGFILTSFTLFGIRQSKFDNTFARILAQKLVAHLLAFIMFGFRPLSVKNWSGNPPTAEFVQTLEKTLFCLTYGISLNYVGVLVYLLSIVVYPTLKPYNCRR